MLRKPKKLTPQQKQRMQAELSDAYDFDPRDPLFGLSKDQLSGPSLSRRATLRLLAASGSLAAWHLMPGTSGKAIAQNRGGDLVAGWSGVGEIVTHPLQ